MASQEIESSSLFGLIAGGIGVLVLLAIIIAAMWHATAWN